MDTKFFQGITGWRGTGDEETVLQRARRICAAPLRPLMRTGASVTCAFFMALTLVTVQGSVDAVHAQFTTGAVLDPQAYLGVPKGPPRARGDYGSLSASMSLKAFAPTPGDQGKQGSCVGWATAYAARTLAEAKRLDVGSKSAINQSAFSPSFVYNQIRRGDCEGGSLPGDALELLATYGVAPLSDFPYSDKSCSLRPTSAVMSLAENYRIKDYKRLFNSHSSAKHVAVRRSLADGHPVVIGMMVSNAFMRSQNRYVPAPEDEVDLAEGALGGHAMTVIGYDDAKFGGAFELINSWGTGWGNGGFIWVTYDDFNTFVMQGFEMIPPDPPKPPAVVDMSGEVRFMHISGKAMTGGPSSGEASFHLDDSYPSGPRFRVEVEVGKDGYVYALGGDLSGRFVKLFPRGDGVSAHVGGGSSTLMPGPSEEFYTRMNDDVGTDFYVVLFSREVLPIDDILAGVNGASGNVREKLTMALGTRLVPPENVKAADTSIAFEAASDGASVVPVVVAIEHVGRSESDRDRAAPRLVVAEPGADELEQVITADPVRRVATPVFLLRGTAQDESLIQSVSISGATASTFSSRGPFEAEIELPQDGRPHPVTIVAVDADGNRSESTVQIMVAP